MKRKKYVMVLIVVAALLLAPALAGAQYSDSITDSTNDVDHYQWSDTGYSIEEDVTRDNIDIVRVSIDESGGDLTVELEVEGTIQSDEQSDSNMVYIISMEDGDGDSYQMYYYFGQVYIEWPDGIQYDFTTPSGFGTSTLEIEFSLDTINNPDSLELTSATTYEYTESEGSGEYYMDEAEPGADDTNGDGTNGDGDTDGEIDFDEGIIDDLIARGMMCLLIAIIIPMIIVIIVIIVIIKIVKKDDKGDGGQPPRQEYQQPPPPAQAPRSPERQYQEPVPPEETGGEVSPGEEKI